MDLTAIFRAVPTPETSRGAEDAPAGLRIGDRLTGRVLRLETDGRVLIDLGRFRALAHTTIAVQPGQMLQLKVAQTGVPIQLRLDAGALETGARPLPELALSHLPAPEDQQRVIQAIDRFISATAGRVDSPLLQSGTAPEPPMGGEPSVAAGGQTLERVRQALMHLRALFAPWPGAPSADQLAHWVRAAVEDRGILFEIKLADALAGRAGAGPAESMDHLVRGVILRDLKPQLLILNAFLGGSEHPAAMGVKQREITLLRQVTTQLLTHVEQQQERAVQRAGGQELFQVLAHLLPLKEGRQPVRLKVYYPRRRRGGRDQTGHRLALLLDMDRLGPVRVDLSMTAGTEAGKTLQIMFHVRDTAVQSRLEQGTPSVIKALDGFFECIHVSTLVSSGDTVARFGDEDLEGPATGGIDIRA